MSYARHLRPETIDFLIGDTAPLPKDAALLALVAAITADGHADETANVLGYVLRAHPDPEQVREIIVQTHLFAGYPRALNALSAMRQAAEKASVDLKNLRSKPIEDDLGGAELLKRGQALWAAVYGEAAGKIAANAQALSPDLAYWSQLEGYGRVLSRPGVDRLTRQYCIIAALMLMDVTPQLKGHVQGALNLGASKDQLWTLLTTVRKLFEADRLFVAVQRTFESVLGKKASDISLEEERRYQW